MYNYFQGKFTEITPTHVVIDCNGVGYMLSISLNTYGNINTKLEGKLFAHLYIREDQHQLFGFFTEHEREVFRLLISVSGVGVTTARLILSSLSAGDVEMAILAGDSAVFQRVKGIGAKSAQRLIVDLKDKVGKSGTGSQPFDTRIVGAQEEALSALLALGFQRSSAAKAISQATAGQKEPLAVEAIIKLSLRYL
jgi:holliday junction DNA helicase RuvA